MRKTSEIVNDVKFGEKPSYDELCHTVLALLKVVQINDKDLRELLLESERNADLSGVLKYQAVCSQVHVNQAEIVKMWTRDPEKYLGEFRFSNDEWPQELPRIET